MSRFILYLSIHIFGKKIKGSYFGKSLFMSQMDEKRGEKTPLEFICKFFTKFLL